MTEPARAPPNGTTAPGPSGASARPLPDGVVAQGDAPYLEALQRAAAVDAGASGSTATNATASSARPATASPATATAWSCSAASAPAVLPLAAATRRERRRQLIDVITNGYGIMFSYAARVAPRDRWAIVAYIRALQLSRHAAAGRGAAP